MTTQGLSERRALAAAGMSASALRYSPRPDRNVALRQKIIDLAHRHRRYGVGMIHLKLGQAGEKVNYKRVERLYREAQLQVRRRKRKKVPIGQRQPLERPTQANEVWSMDFVFDRTADSRVIKCLTIVDDATHESVAIETERAISGHGVVRVLERLALSRGLPKVIRSDNGKEFCGRTMLTWAHERGVLLRLIEPGKQRQLEREKTEHSRERTALSAELKAVRNDVRTSERDRAARDAQILKLQHEIKRLRTSRPAGKPRKSPGTAAKKA